MVRVQYKIIFWDDMNTMREKIKQGLNEQLNKLMNNKLNATAGSAVVLGGSNEMNHHDATQQGDAA